MPKACGHTRSSRLTDEVIPARWFTDRGLKLAMTMFEDDAPEALADAWYEEGISDCRGWTPTPPVGSGWFVFSIHDTEEGPACIWVRHTATQ